MRLVWLGSTLDLRLPLAILLVGERKSRVRKSFPRQYKASTLPRLLQMPPRGNARQLRSSISVWIWSGSRNSKGPRDAVCRSTGVWICPSTHQPCPGYGLIALLPSRWLGKGYGSKSRQKIRVDGTRQQRLSSKGKKKPYRKTAGPPSPGGWA